MLTHSCCFTAFFSCEKNSPDSIRQKREKNTDSSHQKLQLTPSTNSVGNSLIQRPKLCVPFLNSSILFHSLRPANTNTKVKTQFFTIGRCKKLINCKVKIDLSPRSNSRFTWSICPCILLSNIRDTNSCSTSPSGTLSSCTENIQVTKHDFT